MSLILLDFARCRRVLLAAAVLTTPVFAGQQAFATDRPASEQCAIPATLAASHTKLPRLASRISRGDSIKIVALGSSSTSGAGASSTAANYPSRLEAELKRMMPKSHVTVLNKGVSGDRVEQMLKRLDRDVIDEQPNLLIWQVGTNSALNGDDPGQFMEELVQGLNRVRDAGIEMILMTPQFSPRFENTRSRKVFISQITTIAELRGVPVVRRYEMMKHWVKSGQMTSAEMINPDGLHLTDHSYYCVGLQTAMLVARVAGPPATVATNAAPTRR